MIRVTDRITLAESELEITFVRSSGPGGQNVNKVATAAQLRFDAAGSRSLPDDVRARLLAKAGSRLTREGKLVWSVRWSRPLVASNRSTPGCSVPTARVRLSGEKARAITGDETGIERRIAPVFQSQTRRTPPPVETSC